MLHCTRSGLVRAILRMYSGCFYGRLSRSISIRTYGHVWYEHTFLANPTQCGVNTMQLIINGLYYQQRRNAAYRLCVVILALNLSYTYTA